jgi:hypothetical protein
MIAMSNLDVEYLADLDFEFPRPDDLGLLVLLLEVDLTTLLDGLSHAKGGDVLRFSLASEDGIAQLGSLLQLIILIDHMMTKLFNSWLIR